MQLRVAQLSDIAACGELDAGYTTDHSWQLSEEHALGQGSLDLSVTLRCVQLPRPRAVLPPDPTEELERAWDTTDLWIVAGEGRASGYLCADVERGAARVTRIVVDRQYRRAGVGTQLLSAARAWAVENNLRCLIAAVPMKNYPAVALFRASGYRICGYNELHFDTGDVALYLGYEIRDK